MMFALELFAMLGGSVLGFIMKLIAVQTEASASAVQQMIRLQGGADMSADRAHSRGGTWMRRIITGSVVCAMVLFPFLLSLVNIPVTVEEDRYWWDVLKVFSGGWVQLDGFVILPEVRQAMLAIVGFYFGSSCVRRPR